MGLMRDAANQMKWFLAAGIGMICAVPLLIMASGLQDRFLYYPMRYPQGAWERQAQAGAEERWIVTADGQRLNCAWYPQTSARMATLFLHGNAGNVTHRVDHAEAIRQAGSACLIVDYRGYGKSEGLPSEAGLYADGQAAYEELIRLGYAPNRIVLHGESLGTAVATDLAVRNPSAALILEAPFMSVSKMAARVLPLLGPLLARGFDTYAKISRVHVPMLVMHGTADEMIPVSHGRAVFQRANEPKQFWELPQAHHNDLLDTAGPEYVHRLRAFYASLQR